MAKKVTLTVPEALLSKIDEWRHSFNLSKLFQDAVAEAIKKKEEFGRAVSREIDLEAVVERLRGEKRDWKRKASERGLADGAAWAASASYEDLAAAAGGDPGASLRATDVGWACYPGMENVEGGERDEAEASYREGWERGVSQFWDLVKDRI